MSAEEDQDTVRIKLEPEDALECDPEVAETLVNLVNDSIPQDECGYTCDVCGFTTGGRRRFVTHVSRGHDTTASVVPKEEALSDGEERRGERRQSGRLRKTTRPFLCDYDDDDSGEFASPRRRRRNPAAVRRRRKRAEGELGGDAGGERTRQFACDMCDYKAYRLDHLKCHLVTHSDVKPYSCDQCDYTTPRRYHLKRHKMIHTGERPHKCRLCDYRAVQHSHVTHHMATLHSIGPLVCTECPFTADQPRKLELHKLRTHSDRKPFSCPQCDYTTSWRNLLKSHMVKHGGEAPHSCPTCGYKTAMISRLKRHMATHLGSKPYGCQMCGYRASQLDHVKRHERVVHLGLRDGAKRAKRPVVALTEQQEALDYSVKGLGGKRHHPKRRRSSADLPYVGFLAETTHDVN